MHLFIVVIFMELGRACTFWGDFEVVIWGSSQKGMALFFRAELTHKSKMKRF